MTPEPIDGVAPRHGLPVSLRAVKRLGPLLLLLLLALQGFLLSNAASARLDRAAVRADFKTHAPHCRTLHCDRRCSTPSVSERAPGTTLRGELSDDDEDGVAHAEHVAKLVGHFLVTRQPVAVAESVPLLERRVTAPIRAPPLA